VTAAIQRGRRYRKCYEPWEDRPPETGSAGKVPAFVSLSDQKAPSVGLYGRRAAPVATLLWRFLIWPHRSNT